MISCLTLKDNRYRTYEKSVHEFFKGTYQEMDLKKYQGRMDISFTGQDTIVKLDSIDVKFDSENSDYLELFRNRLFPEDILYTNTLDEVSICCFEQFDFLKTNKSVRRFKFWKYDSRWVNPTAYYFELTNEEANRRTDLKTFIEGARLTYISGPFPQL